MLWPLSVVLVANREKLPGCEYQRTVGYPSTSWASCLFHYTLIRGILYQVMLCQITR